MRPPTRSTRSVRTHSAKTATNARRRSRGTSGPPTSLASSETGNTNTAPGEEETKVDPGTSPGDGGSRSSSFVPTAQAASPPPPPPAPVIGCFPVFPPPAAATTTFVLENDSRPSSRPVDSDRPNPGSLSPLLPIVSGNMKPRHRHRMSSEKLETLDAVFRRNTHPSRKEKEAICKDLDVDIKTVTIWFQNKRQTVARSKKLLHSEGVNASASATANDASSTTVTAMDMLASTSAKMSPLAPSPAADVKPSAASTTSAEITSVQPGSDIGRPRSQCSSSLDRSIPRLRLQRTKSLPLARSRPPFRLSAMAYDSNIFESTRAQPSSTRVSPPSPDLRKPRLGHDWPIHPEDLWKHIPSSPALPVLSSPDVSPDIDTPSRSSRFSTVQKPRTLEWACARSAKRRRTNADDEDEETRSERGSVDHSYPCRPSFSVSEARVPLECYDKYPLDVVRDAVLLLGLKDARHGLGV